jgi:hypothetical protein
MEQGDLARRLIVFADSQFLLGAIIDVAVSLHAVSLPSFFFTMWLNIFLLYQNHKALILLLIR